MSSTAVVSEQTVVAAAGEQERQTPAAGEQTDTAERKKLSMI